jgi:hypothetical protein|nr:MAG TPA: Protein of unknown function (DUF3789) [Caudoviricetes sp.]
MNIGLILAFIAVFIIGLFLGIGIMCFMRTAKEADLQIVLLNIMDQLKKDRTEAERDKQKYNISKGIYLQADKTIQLIKKLYGGIC